SGESKESDLAARGGDDGCRGRGGLALGRVRLAGWPSAQRSSSVGRRTTTGDPSATNAERGVPSRTLPSSVPESALHAPAARTRRAVRTGQDGCSTPYSRVLPVRVRP